MSDPLGDLVYVSDVFARLKSLGSSSSSAKKWREKWEKMWIALGGDWGALIVKDLGGGGERVEDEEEVDSDDEEGDFEVIGGGW